jgi:pyridoxal phosphate enzyme (YggS family)
MTGSPDRRQEIAAHLAGLRHRITQACWRAGRHPADVTLIAVTKTFPAEDIRILATLGVADVGENRDQEARAKHAELAALPIRWHFVGQLQTNKARSVAGYADFVHSVDRPDLVPPLSAGATRTGRTLTGLVQVALDGAPGRGGARPQDVEALAEAIATAPGLQLGGVMAIAPRGLPAAPAFGRLADLAARLQRSHPGARIISAGMSSDFVEAISAGATHIRVGTALLGHRDPVVR